VKGLARTFDTNYRAMHWQSAPGPKLFGGLVNQKMFEYYLNEAAESRFWAGIHFCSDLTAGLALGRSVAQLVIEQRAKTDGEDQ